MNGLSTRVPDRRQRWIVISCFLIAAAAVVIAALTSRAEDWHPFDLFLILAGFYLASEWFAVRHSPPQGTPLCLVPGAGIVLAMALLGPAPALLIGLIGLTVSDIHARTPFVLRAGNFANYGIFIVAGGLVCRWLIDSWGLLPDELGFALLVVGLCFYEEYTSFLLHSFHGRLVYGESIADQWRRGHNRWLGADEPMAVLTGITAYAYGTVGLVALALLAIVFLIQQKLLRSLTVSQQRAEALEEHAKQLSELSESRGRLVGQVLAAEETERRRLAEALHDEALQNLLFARQGFPAGVSDKADRAREAIARTIEQLRGAIFDLHPAILEHAGLEAALREVADHQAERAGFQADVDVDPEACGPLDSLLFVLGREQLTNAAKHSGATEVGLKVARSNGRVVMEVVDNGCGMGANSPYEAVPEGHIGLASSAERVEALGGELEIGSRVGGGTRVRTTLPLRSS